MAILTPYIKNMNTLLSKQYQLLKESREVVFHFLESEVQMDISAKVSVFNNKNVIYMLVHVANTYLAWVDIFALKSDRKYYDEKDFSSTLQLRLLFEEVNTIMGTFLVRFKEEPLKSVAGYKWENKFIETDALAIFTHVITHEFHHKGQIMSMCGLLGHTPPDTDIMRF